MKLAFSISKLWKFMLCPLKDKFISDSEIICLTALNQCRNIGECNDSKNKQAFYINAELYSFCLFYFILWRTHVLIFYQSLNDGI